MKRLGLCINENEISILKTNPQTGLLMTENVPIELTLDEDFLVVESMLADTKTTAREVVTYIKNHPRLCVLFSKFDYYIPGGHFFHLENGSFTGQRSIVMHYAKAIDGNVENEEKEKKLLLDECMERLKAFHLQEAVKIWEAKRLENEIIAYSHRKINWSVPVYKLNEDLSLEIKTNFSLGLKSYFFIKIRYKGIDIIPFSEWIYYETCKISELVAYTRSYDVRDYKWPYAFGFARDACNLCQTDENAFIQKYMLFQCKVLTGGLEDILKTSTYEFVNGEGDYDYPTRKYGHDLIRFRGEKVTGALNFIKYIRSYDRFFGTGEFIDSILQCNRLIAPVLINEARLMQKELNDMNIRLKQMKKKYAPVAARNAEFNKAKKEFQKSLIEDSGEPYKNIDISESRFSEEFPGYKYFNELFVEKYPEYPDFEEEFDEIQYEYDKQKLDIKFLKENKETIEGFFKAIDSYFTENGIAL